MLIRWAEGLDIPEAPANPWVLSNLGQRAGSPQWRHSGARQSSLLRPFQPADDFVISMRTPSISGLMTSQLPQLH